MPELAYGEVYAMNRIEARPLLIQTYEQTGSYSETARLWHTWRHLVRKWVRRYQELGEDGVWRINLAGRTTAPARRRLTLSSR